jgi:hypothetical protein
VELTVAGRRVFVTRPDMPALNKAATNAQLDRGCDIAIGME